MGKFVKKLLDAIRLTDDDDFENEEEDSEEEENESNRKPESKIRRYEEDSDDEENEDNEEEDTEAPAYRRNFLKGNSSVTSSYSQKRAAVPLRSTIADRRIYVLNPKSFEDAQEVCETLKTGGVIFLNFEGVKYELAQRLMDFAGGSVYALDGQIYQITGYSFIVAPRDMDIEGDILAQINSAGSKFPYFQNRNN